MNQLTFSASSYKPRKIYCSYRQSLELERLYVRGKKSCIDQVAMEKRRELLVAFMGLKKASKSNMP